MKKYLIVFIGSVLLNHLILCDTLDQIAIKYGTDKNSNSHNYTEVYEHHFHHLKNIPIKFLEIGFLLGASARMWDEYFLKAQLYFIDVNPECYKYAKNLSNCCHLDMVDQGNKNALINYIQKVGGDFDIIIDDGGHTMNQQITSFKALFPYVKSGGIYVIEDLYTSYWKEFGGHGSVNNPKAGQGTTINFLKDLIDDLNFIGASSGHANQNIYPENMAQSLSYYKWNIKGIYFYSSVCFIIKR